MNEQRATHTMSKIGARVFFLNGWPLETVDRRVDHEAAVDMWIMEPIQIRSNTVGMISQGVNPRRGGRETPAGGEKPIHPNGTAHMRRHRSWARPVGILT